MPGLIHGSDCMVVNVRNRVTARMFGALLCVAVLGIAAFGPALAPDDPYQTHPLSQFARPSAQHLYGTDELGRDVLSRFLWGARYSLGDALQSTLLAVVLGLILSALTVLAHPGIDQLIGHLLDMMLTFPNLLLALVAAAILGRGTWQVAVAVGISLAPAYARLVRGSIITTRGQPYINAAYALGASKWWVITQHLIRNIIPPAATFATVIFAWSLMSTSALEFLGLAGPPEIPTWGNMIAVGRAYLLETSWPVLAPGLALCLSVLGATLLGNTSLKWFRVTR